jgi:hypothetical protein
VSAAKTRPLPPEPKRLPTLNSSKRGASIARDATPPFAPRQSRRNMDLLF